MPMQSRRRSRCRATMLRISASSSAQPLLDPAFKYLDRHCQRLGGGAITERETVNGIRDLAVDDGKLALVQSENRGIAIGGLQEDHCRLVTNEGRHSRY